LRSRKGSEGRGNEYFELVRAQDTHDRRRCLDQDGSAIERNDRFGELSQYGTSRALGTTQAARGYKIQPWRPFPLDESEVAVLAFSGAGRKLVREMLMLLFVM
jgi:hypothetical protein